MVLHRDTSGSVVVDDFRPSDTLAQALFTIGIILWYRRIWIVGVAVACMSLAVFALAFTEPLYSATAKILIEPRPRQLLQTEVLPTGLGHSSVGPDTLLVDSQVEIIRSDVVLDRVVQSLRLDTDPEFATPQGSGLGGLLIGVGRSFAYANRSQAVLAQSPAAAALDTLRRRLRVERVGNTYLITLNVLSAQPALAAQLADAIADGYITDVEEAQREATRQTTTLLSARLEQLGRDVQMRERAVDSFREANGLIGNQDSNINEQQLSSVNERLAAARIRTSEARVRSNRLTQLSREGVNGAETTREAFGSSVIAELRASHAQLSREISNSELVYGNRHPRIQTLAAERRSIAEALSAELERLRRAAASEYELALQDQRALEVQLGELESVTVDSNRTLVTLRELEREAAAARSVYEAYLHRSRQTGEQENLSVANARVLARAEPPHRPAYPPTLMVLLAALTLGMIIGVSTAWVRHIWNEFRQNSMSEKQLMPAPSQTVKRRRTPSLLDRERVT